MNAAQTSTRSTKALAFVLTGPVIWAGHFFALYATEGFLCRGATFPAAADAVRPISLTLTVIALAALSIFVSWQTLQGLRTKRGADSIDAHVYRKISIGLAAIALLAVTWGVLPAILLPACMPAA
jgi:hypothetical protein